MLCQICKALPALVGLMAPSPLLALFSPRHVSEASSTFRAVRLQWRSPTDILTILMVIGGDIVQRALAQLAGDPPIPYIGFSIAPVAFSFGWVAYAFMAVLSAIGDGRIMPNPESPVSVINIESGYARPNRSWVLARLFRDFPRVHGPKVHEGLSVHFYHVSRDRPETHPRRDWVWWLGVCTIIAQLGISVIPGACDGNWVILIIVAGGTILALATTALPQWHYEKWAARPLKEGHRRVICLTAGNGSQNVLVVVSEGGLRLEDLAAGRHEAGWSNVVTLYASFVLALLWLVHLVTVEAVQDGAWYLLAAGGLGMVQNVIAAGARRTPDALGLHLEHQRTCHDDKVFRALQAAEEVEPGAGLKLVPIFFPGGLRPDEEKWVNQRRALNAEKAHRPHSTPKRDDTFRDEKMAKYSGETLVGLGETVLPKKKSSDVEAGVEGPLPFPVTLSPTSTFILPSTEPSPPSSRASFHQSRS